MVLLLQKFVFYAMAFLCCICRSSSLRCVAPAHDEFKCNDEKKCIPNSYRCDGIPDCDDSSDESGTECRCNDGEYLCYFFDGNRCLGGTRVCDGHSDCSDGSDEKNCGNITTCKVNEFRCVNGQKCIPMRLRCNGKHSLCRDKSDNRDCTDARGCPAGQLDCDSGGCLRKELFCDGRENCADGSDEKNCGYEDSDILFTNEGPRIYAKKKTKAGLEFSDLLHLTHYNNRTAPKGMKVTGLAFDAGKQILFISDASGPAILAVHVPSSEWWYLVNENIKFPMDVAYDWSSNNLYWLDSGMAEVVSVKEDSRTFIIRDLPNPVSLSLSPTTGTMFIATTGFESHLFMYGMDGKNKRILDSVLGTPASLAVHPTRSILYWTDPGEGTISYINYSSSRSPKILRKNLEGVMSVTVTERDYYFTSGIIASGRGKNPGCEKDEGWKSITSGVKPSGKSLCLFGNGGCDFLCLTSEVGTSCACPPEGTLDQDGKRCRRDKH